jgi:hypothetical protein
MATIITVHGTGATGPEEGQAWWQKGSPFDKHMRELVEGEDGHISVQPMIWDGANSETSRRAAAAKLYSAMMAQEAKAQQYCVVGHSHGGSVIADALMFAASNRNKLRHLMRWVTVGTPFIQSTKAYWLFSRSGLLGKSALVSVAAFAFLLLTYLKPGAWGGATKILQFGYVFVVPLCVLYSALWLFNRRKFYMYRPRTLRFVANEYAPRLTPLHHKSDEAINGLQSLKLLNIDFFPGEFAVPLFSFLSIFLLPTLLVALAMYPEAVVKLETLIAGSAFGAPSVGLFDNLARITDIFAGFFARMATPLLNKYVVDNFIMAISYAALAFYLVGPFVFIPISLAITYFVSVVSRAISRILSATLNRLTRQQIRKTGFGNDTVGELSVDASKALPWVAAPFSALPEQLAQEIADLSNQAAPVALVKFRDGINQLALSKDKEAKAFFFSEYLTWDELIHCSYFGVPRFRMLVAYAMAHSPGFRPSAVFKSHPDYELVGKWHEEIQPKR